MQTSRARRLTAEGVGTALLLAAVVGSGIMGDRLAGGNVAVALLANTVATAATLITLITVLGPVSGAQFNPVVSLWAAATGRRPCRPCSNLSTNSTWQVTYPEAHRSSGQPGYRAPVTQKIILR